MPCFFNLAALHRFDTSQVIPGVQAKFVSLGINLCAGRQDKASKKWNEKKTFEQAPGQLPTQHSDPYEPKDPDWHHDY